MKRLLALLLLLVLPLHLLQAHPLKMAYTSVKYNAARQVFEITQRVFQDDFEMTLRERYGYRGGDVYEQQKTAVTQQAVNGFFEKNFTLFFNNTPAKLRYLKTDQQQQMGIVVHYETEKILLKNLKTITVQNTIMMESFAEQVNMFHLNIKDEVKRTLKFEVGQTKGMINL